MLSKVLAMTGGVAVLSASTATQLNTTLAVTPFGLVHHDCVHYAPRGAVIKELSTHTELHHRDGRVERFEPCDPIDPRHGRGGFTTKSSDENNRGMDLEGWIDYTGWYPTTSGYETPITSFTSYNSVPDTPANTVGQTLYWFIGMQNNEDSKVRILQPVLTYNGVGGGATGAPTGWSFMSWNCCPMGQVWYSDPITDFTTGDTLFGEMASTDGGKTYTITSSTPSSSTELTVDTAGLTFDWADVTLEVYSVTDCDQFPSAGVDFTDMKIESGGQAVTADWSVKQGSSCHDKVSVMDAADVSIFATP